MVDDIKRALLGDKEAAKRLTDAGVLLPCPFCGSKNIRTSNWGMWRCWCSDCLGKSDDFLSERKAIKHWNTRAPILSSEEMEMLHGKENP